MKTMKKTIKNISMFLKKFNINQIILKNSTLNSFKTFQNQFQKLKKSISNIVT